jgi:hypothetical protein
LVSLILVFQPRVITIQTTNRPQQSTETTPIEPKTDNTQSILNYLSSLPNIQYAVQKPLTVITTVVRITNIGIGTESITLSFPSNVQIGETFIGDGGHEYYNTISESVYALKPNQTIIIVIYDSSLFG